MADPMPALDDTYGAPTYQRRSRSSLRQAIRVVPVPQAGGIGADPFDQDGPDDDAAPSQLRELRDGQLSPVQEASVLGALGDLAEAKLSLVRLFSLNGEGKAKQEARAIFSRVDLAMTRLRSVASFAS